MNLYRWTNGPGEHPSIYNTIVVILIRSDLQSRVQIGMGQLLQERPGCECDRIPTVFTHAYPLYSAN